MLLVFVFGVAAFVLVVHRIVVTTSAAGPEKGSPDWVGWLIGRPKIPDTVPPEWVDAYRSGAE
jgi:hypothetical protein